MKIKNMTKLNLLYLVVLVQFLEKLKAQPDKKFFRKDYTYLPVSNNFYKIHTIHRTWQDAKTRCAMEGAKLFYPQDAQEAGDVLSFWNQTQPFYWVFIGISDSIAKGVFETIDGLSVNDVYNVWGPGEPNDHEGMEGCLILRREGTLNDDRCDRKYPFICKKAFSELEWNHACDMPNRDYVFNSELGKCYKFHRNPRNWTDAVSICSAEQSYLAVVESQAEADYLVKLTADMIKNVNVQGDYLGGVVYLGFHNRNQEGWQTIKGVPLHDSGYATWGGGQPDGSGGREVCGSMFYNGQLNDLNCDYRCFFVCEHDVGTLSDSYDDRFGD